MSLVGCALDDLHALPFILIAFAIEHSDPVLHLQICKEKKDG